jgi:hypothetical protein
MAFGCVASGESTERRKAAGLENRRRGDRVPHQRLETFREVHSSK